MQLIRSLARGVFKPRPLKDAHPPGSRATKEDIDEELLEKVRLTRQQLPKRLLERAKQVFSKYDQATVRKMAAELRLLYYNLHAEEKPGDITRLPPFSNYRELSDPEHNYEKQIHLSSPQKQLQMEMQGFNVPAVKQQRSGGSAVGQPLVNYTQNMAVAFLYKGAPSSFAIACRIFTEIKYRYPDQKFKSILDFGAGLGSASAAFIDIFQGSKLFAVEQNSAMRKMGQFLNKQIDKITWLSSLSQGFSHQGFREFDVAYAGNVLQELPSAAAREMLLQSLLLKLREGGFLIVVEPGTVLGFRFTHDVRSWGIKKGLDLIAPCPHSHQCPLAKSNKWCHFQQPVAHYPRQVIAKYPLEKDTLYQKFTYMVFRKSAPPLPLQQSQQAKQPLQAVREWDRILFPLLLRGGHFLVDLCSREGKFQRLVVSRVQGQRYKKGRKLRWGDMWRFGRYFPNKFRKAHLIKSKRLW